jgi:hypothetical protein
MAMPPDGPTESSATPGPPPAPPPPPFGGETVVAGTTSGGGTGPGAPTSIAITDIARLPIPGNAEFALWLFLEIVFTLIWWLTTTSTRTPGW